MRFTIQGRSHHLSADDVRETLAGRRPGPIQTHWVAVSGIQWPIKQALEAADHCAAGWLVQPALAELERSLLHSEPGGLAELTHSPRVGGALIESAMLAPAGPTGCRG